MFKVIKKINNNFVVAYDEQGREVLLRGRGLGFRRTPYTLPNDFEVENSYTSLDDRRLHNLIRTLPAGILEVTTEIIEEGERMLGARLSDSLLLSLADHLNYAVERAETGVTIDDAVQFDLQLLYPEEMAAGKMALGVVERQLGVSLPANEASFVALHFINARYDMGGMRDTCKFAQTVSDILGIVGNYFVLDGVKGSFDYSRLVTHLRYFVARKYAGVELGGDARGIATSDLLGDEDVRDCIGDIETYVSEEHGWSCSADEKLYLLIHLKVVVSMVKGVPGEGL